MRSVFYLLFAIAFLLPMAANIYVSSHPEMRALYLVVFRYFNIVYYIVLIVFLFASFKFKEAAVGGIVFILGFFGFVYVKEFVLAKNSCEKKAKELKGVCIDLDALKSFGSFKLLYKDGYYVVVKKASYDHALPFNYKKERR